jgi:hypothetical protein
MITILKIMLNQNIWFLNLSNFKTYHNHLKVKSVILGNKLYMIQAKKKTFDLESENLNPNSIYILFKTNFESYKILMESL